MHPPQRHQVKKMLTDLGNSIEDLYHYKSVTFFYTPTINKQSK